ncbi:MAG: TRAP transporter substrate-binding protein DctP [Alphaproteobacteria bacterium]
MPPRAGTIALDRLADLVGAETNGNFSIKVVYGGVLANEEIIDGLKINAFEAGWVVPAFSPGKQPTQQFLAMPFMPMGDLATATKISHKFQQHPAVKRDFDGWSIRYILTTPIPGYEFIGRGKAPETLADWKGKRVRAIGGFGSAMSKIGAVPTSVVPTELYGAMERGLVDAAALPYYAFETYKLCDISHWYTKGMALGSVMSNVSANAGAFEQLPPQYRALIDRVAITAMDDQVAGLQKDEDKAEEICKARGVKTVAFSAKMRDELAQVGGRPVWDEWVKEVTAKGYPGKELLDYLLDEARKAGA